MEIMIETPPTAPTIIYGDVYGENYLETFREEIIAAVLVELRAQGASAAETHLQADDGASDRVDASERLARGLRSGELVEQLGADRQRRSELSAVGADGTPVSELGVRDVPYFHGPTLPAAERSDTAGWALRFWQCQWCSTLRDPYPL